jgi:hypothetical protein
MIWATLPGFDLGFLPGFLSEDDPRPAAEQFADHYIGGWFPLPGCTLGPNLTLLYPGDPALRPRAMTQLRHEVIIVYDHDFVAIIQPNREFEVARMD